MDKNQAVQITKIVGTVAALVVAVRIGRNVILDSVTKLASSENS